MNKLIAILDDGETESYLKQLAAQKSVTHSTSDTMLLGSVLLGLTLALFLFAYLLRRKRRQGLSRSPHPPSFSEKAARKSAASVQSGRRRRKWRRRREHRPRNPTLAETGGLPPIRTEDQSPPPP